MPRRLLLLGALAASACAPHTYLYGFDIADPGAVNYKDFRRPDVLEDSDVKLEVRVDPTEFRSVALDLTNKTDQSLQVSWDHVVIVGPDKVEVPLASQSQLGAIEPGAKLPAVLGPFELPAVGSPAKAYDGTTFELVVPTMLRGNPHEYRIHLHVTMKRL